MTTCALLVGTFCQQLNHFKLKEEGTVRVQTWMGFKQVGVQQKVKTHMWMRELIPLRCKCQYCW